jgi:hypothetical protein
MPQYNYGKNNRRKLRFHAAAFAVIEDTKVLLQ